MKTKQILTIVSLSMMGLCLICGLAKMAMKKGAKGKKHFDKACGVFVIVAVVLLAISQWFMGSEETFDESETKKDIACVNEESDIVIIGAGVAGLYCARQILAKNPGKKITIIERLNRTGGRLDSDLIKIKNSSGKTSTIREEEGGMRFTQDMKELNALIDDLDLRGEVTDFPMSPAQPLSNNLYFKGRKFTVNYANENPHIWAELYDLLPHERNHQPSEIFLSIYSRMLIHNKVAVLNFFNGDEKKANIIITQKPAAEVTKLQTPEYWQFMRLNFTWKEAGTIEETPLYKWTLPGLLNAMEYSGGCVEMLTYTLGFKQPMLSLMNAGASFQCLSDFPANPKFHTFKKGFSTLPNKLVSEIGKDKIFLSTNVDKIDSISNSEYKYSLDLSIAPEYQRAFPFTGEIKKTIKTKKIIMAIGRHAMEKLFHSSPSLNNQRNSNQFRKNLPTATNQKLLKINLYFEKDWWNDGLSGKLYGPNMTDLQCNTVYPFYSIDAHKTNKPPATLTIYCDWDNTNYWHGLQTVGKKFSSELQKNHNNDLPQVLYPASEAVVKEARRQIALLFGVPTIPKPKLTSFRLWDGQSDFGYAVHQWKLGSNDKDVIEQMISPFENIYTCNEAWSDMQCWVNGSLRSADLVLSRHFGIESLV